MTAMRGLLVWAWLVTLAGASHARLSAWTSDAALWQNALTVAPTKLRPLLNYGRTRELAGDLVDAERLYRETAARAEMEARRPAQERRFARAAAESNLAHVYIKQGRFRSALLVLDRVLTRWPNFPYAHYNRATIYWVVGACADAQTDYTRAQAGDPDLALPASPCGSLLP